MFTAQKMIDSRLLRLLTICILLLCLAIPALCTAASLANPAAQADGLLLPLISSVIDPPEIPFPKPPPPFYQETTAMEQTASVIDPPEIPFPKPPPPLYQGTSAMEQTA